MEITKEMSIGDVMRLDPGASEILMSFGMHCFGCPYSLSESLEDACMVHNNDVNDLIRQLNEYFAKKE